MGGTRSGASAVARERDPPAGIEEQVMKPNVLSVVLAAVAAVAFTASAQDLAAVKQRMIERKPAVEKLLAAKTAGENRAGCLEALAALAPADAKTVAEENADRQAVYAAIAAKNGAAAEAVAQQRAETIARTAPAGTMVQAPDGKWTEKK
jgi:uncharacterized protein YdbL (DUF1318 family)